MTVLMLLISTYLWLDARKEQFESLSYTASVLDNYNTLTFYHRELSLASVGSRLLDIQGSSQDSLRLVYARKSLKNYNEFLAFGLADTLGQLTTFTGEQEGVPNPSLIASEASKRSFVKAKKAKGIVIGEVYFFEAIKSWILPIRVPLRNEDGELLGLNTSAIDYQSLNDNLSGFEFDSNITIHFINNVFNTTQLYYPMEKERYGVLLGKSAGIYKDTSYVAPIGRYTGFIATNTYSNQKVLAVATNAGSLEHYFVITAETNVLWAGFFDKARWVLVVYLVLMGLTIIGFRYLQKKEQKYTEDIFIEKEFSDQILKGSPAVIVGIDLEGICKYVNPTAIQTIGYKKEEIVGQNWWTMLYPKDYYEQVERLFAELENGQVEEYEMTLVEKNGHEKIISWNSFNLYDKKGEFVEVIGFGRDVTDLKKAQKELHDYTVNLEKLIKERTKELGGANKALQQSNEQLKDTLANLEKTQNKLFQSDKMASLGVLVAGVGHEINNPLNYIKGGVQAIETLMEDGDPDRDELKALIGIIEDGIKRASNIVKSLSHFSRKSGTMEEVCDVHDIIDNCLVILYNKFKHKVTVHKNYELSERKVIGNTGKLHQVFLNILSNAEQAIEGDGMISITTKIVFNDIIINIKDSGKGIPEKYINQISVPFFTTKNVGEGTGLGLSIAYSIVEDHEGVIEVDSEVGKGSEFIVKLPVK